MQLIEILLVEDNPGDISLTKEAFKGAKVANQIHVVQDGEEALRYLHKKDQYANSKHPDIILLDLNLPKKDGREVLKEIKNDPDLRRIPVVILTTSKAEEDIIGAYDNHANCYIRKPVDFQRFMEIVHQIESFWLSIVKLPPQ